MGNDFPRMGINTAELKAEVERLLDRARDDRASLGAVNWADLGVTDIEYRLSMLHPGGPECVVMVEEASPECGLARWIMDRLDATKFPGVRVECEW